MKGLVALAFFVLLIAVAGAKPGPVDEPRPALALNEADIAIGPREVPRAAALERNYFEAQQPQFNAGSFPCRLQPTVFEKTRLAQACH
jgi:hypothetical protein